MENDKKKKRLLQFLVLSQGQTIWETYATYTEKPLISSSIKQGLPFLKMIYSTFLQSPFKNLTPNGTLMNSS